MIVGGGLAGLSCAAFLARMGISVRLFEKRSGTSIYPKAAGQNPRTMELFGYAGLADDVLAVDDIRGSGGEFSIRVVETIPGRVLHSFAESFDELAGATKASSPAPWGMAAQDKLEPVLVHAARQAGAEICFSTTVHGFDASDEGVSVSATGPEGEEIVACARYLVAADGPQSPIREALGIDQHGAGTFARYLTMIFEADLSGTVPSASTGWYYIQNREFTGTFGPTTSADRYTFYLETSSQPGTIDQELCVKLLRIALEAPELEPRVLDLQPWEMAAYLADTWRSGPVLLMGDAAKVTPPTGGMGGNSAIGDAFDAAWKLATVLKGQASEELLDSYAVERRDAAALVIQESMAIYAERMAPHLQQEAGRPRGQAAVLLGFRCQSGAVVDESDGDDEPCEDPAYASGRPGFRAPHVWISRAGNKVSTLDYFGTDWVLLAAAQAAPGWESAVAPAFSTSLGLPIQVYREDQAWTSLEERVSDRYGLGRSGVSLIRPDGVVAWRADTATWTAEECSAVLAEVLGGALGR